MPISRFSDIKRSNKLSEAYTNYKNWQDRPYDPQPNSRGASKNTKLVYVNPFGLPVVVGELYSSKTDPDTYPELSALVNGSDGGEVTDTLGSSTVKRLKGFSAARVIWFRNAARTVSVKRSDITGLNYLKYTGNRLSIPFGQATGTDEEIAVFNSIKASALSNGSFDVSRVSLKRERIDL